jgi:hypothetical protein
VHAGVWASAVVVGEKREGGVSGGIVAGMMSTIGAEETTSSTGTEREHSVAM